LRVCREHRKFAPSWYSLTSKAGVIAKLKDSPPKTGYPTNLGTVSIAVNVVKKTWTLEQTFKCKETPLLYIYIVEMIHLTLTALAAHISEVLHDPFCNNKL